ncbi:hypothetical protein [Rhodoblastus sp.]|jgi:hypothetical protein|uniref:hypothetical protein n=1 Tax=Rhodoblastus sp. TaxID=1962975 RepID=UPI0025DD7177|nr:hypothetical protein [Rhodoblastus sp.]
MCEIIVSSTSFTALHSTSRPGSIDIIWNHRRGFASAMRRHDLLKGEIAPFADGKTSGEMDNKWAEFVTTKRRSLIAGARRKMIITA